MHLHACQYVFAHRQILDFESVLDEQNTIAFPPNVLMEVLYVHTRAETFCFNPFYNLPREFSRYFNLHWAWRFVQTDIDSSDAVPAGHPSGHLQQRGRAMVMSKPYS